MVQVNNKKVDVVYALSNEQIVYSVDFVFQMTIMQAIVQSGILKAYPEINLDQLKVGIFGKFHALTDSIEEGDRIEIYRPLIIDPKQARRIKAKRQ